MTGLSQTFSNGDVFVAVGHGQVQWRNANGALIKTLTATVTTNLATTGMAFDSVGNLYVTMFDSQSVSVFDNSGNFLSSFGSGYNSDPESIVIDSSGNVYVGQADGTHRILKFNLSGNLLQQFTVNTDQRGTDWIDLSGDLCTMYYTSEGKHVQRFDVCANRALSDLNTTPLPGTSAYAHRLLANGDTLVADTEQIVRLDDAGTVIQTYTATGPNNFFALNLDPDGKSFWSGDLSNGNVYKFDIASGSILLQFNAGVSNSVGGITVKGEITASGTARTGVCATRTSRFWFTHATGTDPTCATLLRALQANVGGISLGFLRLPAFLESGGSVLNVNDALQEALGFYWKGKSTTGESDASLKGKVSASSICKQRKLLAIELIAATANVQLLGSDPRDCTYSNGGTITNFPADLLLQARTALSGDDPKAIIAMRALLLKFNIGGQAGPLPSGIAECSPNTSKFLKSIARDPTRQTTCGGINNTCGNAAVVFFSTNAFARAVYEQSISLTPAKFPASFQSPTCGNGGPNAIWQVKPSLGVVNRQFTVNSSGSNFNTLLAVFSGDCASTNFTQVGCADASAVNQGEVLSFTTDGTNTFYIVGEGAAGQFGKLKIKITSP